MRRQLTWIGLLTACAAPAPEASTAAQLHGAVADMMERYQVAARAVIADSIAAFYTETATYFERLAFPGPPISEQHGKFVAEWIRQPNGGWLLQRLFRIPIPTPGPGGRS